jgi:RimJ/RimL family protein N-acetyltransferase
MRLSNFVFEQNMGVRIVIQRPYQCSKEEKDTFINLVLSGKQNTEMHVVSSFDNLVWVGILYEDGIIRAVSSLKDGDEELFYRAGVPDLADDYPYEVGFSFTDPTSRGKGFNTKLKKALFAKVGNRGIYATIRVNNTASLAVNKKLGFKNVGTPYRGLVTDVQLMVYK